MTSSLETTFVPNHSSNEHTTLRNPTHLPTVEGKTEVKESAASNSSVKEGQKVIIEVGIYGDNFPEGLIIQILEVTDPVHLEKSCRLKAALADFPSRVT